MRMALGAQQSSILKLILRKGVRLVATGILIGLFASYGITLRRVLPSHHCGKTRPVPASP
jgi:hypothetical protein